MESFCCDLRGRKYEGSRTIYADKLGHGSISGNLDIISTKEPPSIGESVFYNVKTVYASKRLIL